METTIINGFIGLILTTIIGGIIKAYIDYKSKQRESIFQNRLKGYMEFVKKTKLLPKYSYPPTKLRWEDVAKLPNELKDWYFEGHGIIVSHNFRDKYFNFQDYLKVKITKNEANLDEFLPQEDYDEMRKKLSNLRSIIAKELQSRETGFWVSLPEEIRA